MSIDISKRTKGEWKINPVETLHSDIGIISPLIKEGKEMKYGFHFERIARIEGNFEYEEAEANAACICLAVNNHERLVEAIRGFIDNAIINKKIAENQLSYYKGQFNKLLQSLEND